MRILNKVLQRAYATEFYSQNAMFFLLVIGAAFGFMRGNEHMALAQFIIAAPICTLIPISIWTFYAFKIISFNIRSSRLPEMRFVFDFILLPWNERVVPLILVAVNQSLPAIGYGAFVILVGVRNNAWSEVTILIVALITLIAITTWFLEKSIRHPQYEMKISWLKSRLDERFEKNHTGIFTEWLVRTHPGMVFFTKAASCILIFGVCQLYRYDSYDQRLLAMAALMPFCSALAFVYQYVLFENSRFILLRNLPTEISTRLLRFVTCMIVLSIPEIVVMSWSYPENLTFLHFIEIMIFGLSLLLAGYNFLLRKHITFESLTPKMFFLGITLFLLILLKIPLLLLSALATSYGVISYRRNFYGFEVIVRKENTEHESLHESDG